MALQPALEKKLSGAFPPDSRIDDTFRGKDLTIVTNERGEAITLFIGERSDDGSIRGERYVRRIQRGDSDTIRKSHWELKGKVSRFG